MPSVEIAEKALEASFSGDTGTYYDPGSQFASTPPHPMASPPPLQCFERVDGHKDGAFRGRHPRNCRRF